MNQFMKQITNIILISVVSIIVYSNSFNNSFQYDDAFTIVDNILIRHIESIPQYFAKAVTSNPPKFGKLLYRPLTMTSFTLNYKLGGLNVAGYHIVNVLFHAANAILVYLLIIALLSININNEASTGSLPWQCPSVALPALPKFQRRRGVGGSSAKADKKKYVENNHSYTTALFISLLWATHPINSEAVNYIWQRADVMATFFYLLSVILFLRSLVSNRHILFLLSIGAYIMALMSKETSITLPLIIMLIDLFLVSKFKKDIFIKQFKKYHFMFIFVTLMYLLIRFFYQGIITEFASPTGESPSMLKYFATQFNVIIKYITLIFIPKGLSIYHSIPIVENFMEIKMLMSIMAIILLILLSARLSKVHIISSLFMFWFFITLIPTSSILPGCIVMNEHRVYLPGIGIISALVILLYKFIPEKIHKNILPIFLSIIIILFSAITYNRNKDWKDEASLWSNTVKLYPNDGIAYNYLGMGLYKKGFIDKSIEAFEKAVKYRPNDSLIHNNLGAAYINKNMVDKAMEEFKKSVSLNPGQHDALNNLAGAFFLKGFYGEAIECYKKAIELNPFYIDAYANLGLCYSINKLYDEARNIYGKALEIDPNCISIKNKLQSIKDY